MRRRPAQSTVEYAVLAAVVVGALLVMQIYMKRGFSGKLKESTDRVGGQFTPATATYKLTSTVDGTRKATTTVIGETTSAIIGEEVQGRTGGEAPSQTDIKTEKLWDR